MGFSTRMQCWRILINMHNSRGKASVNTNLMENIAPVDRRETSSVCVFRHCIYEDILEASILSHCGFNPSQARGSCVSI